MMRRMLNWLSTMPWTADIRQQEKQQTELTAKFTCCSQDAQTSDRQTDRLTCRAYTGTPSLCLRHSACTAAPGTSTERRCCIKSKHGEPCSARRRADACQSVSQWSHQRGEISVNSCDEIRRQRASPAAAAAVATAAMRGPASATAVAADNATPPASTKHTGKRRCSADIICGRPFCCSASAL